MRIGQLAQLTGVSTRMLRYYEQEDLLKPGRVTTGYRDYPESAVTVVRHIRKLNEAGLTLKSIRVILPCLRGDVTNPRWVGCTTVRSTLTDELTKLDQKLKELNSSRELVAGFLDQALSNGSMN